MLDALELPFVQRALLETGVLAVAAGVLGTWIVLRGLAFYAHAVGTAAFPGLVLADGLGFAAGLGALGTALVVAGLVTALSRRDREGTDSATALVLVGALAAGVILASDVFESAASVERLLFGSLLLVDARDVAAAVAAAAAVLAASAALGPRWLAAGFDAETARGQGLRSPVPDAVLLVLVALVTVATLSAVGALLATALLVVPAATTRLLVDRMRPWQVATVVLALAEGIAGVLLAVELNAPPGATIAVLAGAVFALVAAGRALRRPSARAARAALAAAPVLALLVSGCGGGAAGGGGDGRVEVVASTTQLGDFARQVGGPDVKVMQLLQPSSDPHDYEPRPRDVRETAKAAVVLTSGGELDAWMDEVVAQSGGDPVVLEAGRGRPHTAGEDPHWWHDPRNVVYVVGRIRDALVQAAPSGRRAAITARANAYTARVRALDRAVAACFARVPPDERKLVTDHDAFGHLAARYGIEVVGAVIPAQTTQAQPSAGEVAALVRTIEREHVRAVFPETSVSPDLARTIARRTGATADLELYADTLGEKGSPGATWLGAAAANADAMVRGFTDGAQRCRAGGAR